MPKVSVIVPNYNHAPYLEKRFDTIFGQTYQDFEVIILDDCSTDNSREVLEKYRNHPKVSQFVYNEKNSGSTFKQWNKGVALAKGEYIWIAESDDEAELEFLQTLVPKLDENANVGIAFCQSLRIDEQSCIIDSMAGVIWGGQSRKYDKSFLMSGSDECADLMFLTNTIPNASGVLFRKMTFNLSGGACEYMRLCGDWLTWVQILLNSDLYFLSKPLNRFRMHKKTVRDSTAPQVFLMEKSIIQSRIMESVFVHRKWLDAAAVENLKSFQDVIFAYPSKITVLWTVNYLWNLKGFGLKVFSKMALIFLKKNQHPLRYCLAKIKRVFRRILS